MDVNIGIFKDTVFHFEVRQVRAGIGEDHDQPASQSFALPVHASDDRAVEIEASAGAKTLPAQEQKIEAIGTVIRSMEELGAGVCIPLTADDQLLGLLAIDDDRMRDPYSTDELDLAMAQGTAVDTGVVS